MLLPLRPLRAGRGGPCRCPTGNHSVTAGPWPGLAGPGQRLCPFLQQGCNCPSLYYQTRRKIIEFSILMSSPDQPRDTTSFKLMVDEGSPQHWHITSESSNYPLV